MRETLAQLEADAARALADAPGSRVARYRPPGVSPANSAGAVIDVVVDPGATLGRGDRALTGREPAPGRRFSSPSPAHATRTRGVLSVAKSSWRAAATIENAKLAQPKAALPPWPEQGATFTLLDDDNLEREAWRVDGANDELDGLIRLEVAR